MIDTFMQLYLLVFSQFVIDCICQLFYIACCITISYDPLNFCKHSRVSTDQIFFIKQITLKLVI